MTDDSTAPRSSFPDIGRWTAAVILIAAIVGFYWKLLLTDQFTWLAGSDTVTQILPWIQFQAGEWHRGRIPLWDPNLWGGQPLIGQVIPGAAYPLNWLLSATPLRDGWVKQIYLHSYLVLIHLMAAWFAYKLARELGCRRLPSVFGGLVFSLAGWFGTTEWPQMLNGAVWAPLVLLYLLRSTRGRSPIRSAILGGFFLGLSWLSGHHQIPIYISLACAGIWLWTLAQSRPRRLLAAFLIFWMMAGCAGALQILPAREYGKLAVRWVGMPQPVGWGEKVAYDVQRDFSFDPAGVLGIVLPDFFVHSNPFLGITALAMALLGIAWTWQRRETRVMVGLSVGGILFALAHHNVLHGVLYALIPNLDKARSPSMAVFVAGLGGAMLAATGLDTLLDRPQSPWTHRVARGCALFAVAVFGVRFVLIEVKGFPGSVEDRSLMIALVALLLSAVLVGRLSSRTLAFAVLGFFLLEAGNINSYGLPTKRETDRLALLTSLSDASDIAEFIRRQPGLPRFEADSNLIPYNMGDWYGLHQSNGYLAGLTSNYLSHWFSEPAFKRLMGVAFFVGKEPAGPFQEAVFRGGNGLRVFQNPDALPRAFAVHRAIQIPSRAQVRENMKDLDTATFLLERPPGLETCGGPDWVGVRTYNANHVQLTASMSCRGMVILTDTFFPGWQATVDGREAKIWEAYALVRGVVVEGGNHVIDFRYRPLSVLAGGILTLIAAICALVAAIGGRAR